MAWVQNSKHKDTSSKLLCAGSFMGGGLRRVSWVRKSNIGEFDNNTNLFGFDFFHIFQPLAPTHYSVLPSYQSDAHLLILTLVFCCPARKTEWNATIVSCSIIIIIIINSNIAHFTITVSMLFTFHSALGIIQPELPWHSKGFFINNINFYPRRYPLIPLDEEKQL